MLQCGQLLSLPLAPLESHGSESSRRQQLLWGQESEKQNLKPSQELLLRLAQDHLDTRERSEQALRWSLLPTQFFSFGPVGLSDYSIPTVARIAQP